MEESHMLRCHRLAPAVAAALATAALLAPVAQARPAVAGAASGGGGSVAIVHDTPLANPVNIPTPEQPAPAGTGKQDRQSGGNGTDWNAVFAGAAGSALIIAMCAGGLSLVRRRALTA
jgi:hypothetical protein